MTFAGCYFVISKQGLSKHNLNPDKVRIKQKCNQIFEPFNNLSTTFPPTTFTCYTSFSFFNHSIIHNNLSHFPIPFKQYASCTILLKQSDIE